MRTLQSNIDPSIMQGETVRGGSKGGRYAVTTEGNYRELIIPVLQKSYRQFRIGEGCRQLAALPLFAQGRMKKPLDGLIKLQGWI